MPFAWAAGALAVGDIASSVIGSDAATSAANTEATAANNASQIQQQQFQQTQQAEAPYAAAGGNALTALQAGLGIGPGGGGVGTGSLNTPFTTADFHNSPGYQFQVQQGENAVLNNASATGGVKSGNTLKALTQFGQGTANQDYWNAYNAYVGQQNQQFNQLNSVVGTGANAVNNTATFGQNTANNVANNTIGAGNAQAAGIVGSASAINNGITGAAGSLSQNFLLSSLLNGSVPGMNGGGGNMTQTGGVDPSGMNWS